jgi:hypothetical protein
MRCESCGLEAPTKSVQLHQNIGMLVMRRSQSVKGNLCKSCIDSYFWRYTLVNSTLGWWGVISVFMTPIFIVNNLFQFIKSRGPGMTSTEVGALPAYVATPAPAQVQCPYCQSYQTQAARLGGETIASLIVAALLLLWGLSLEFAAAQGRTSSGNTIIGAVFIGIAALAAFSLWMAMKNRMWHCQQCGRAWVSRRS